MKYYYFISYFSTEKKESGSFNIKQQGIGSCQIIRSEKITEYDDLLRIAELIENQYERENVIILNYILLKEGESVEEVRSEVSTKQ